MKIIGLTGVAGAGKDTVAAMIAEQVPGAKRQGFADALKLSAARLFNPDIDQAEAIESCNLLKDPKIHIEVTVDHGGYSETVADCSGRVFLQRYGTEAHRDVFGNDFWLDAVLSDGRDDCELLLIPDVRFANEAQRVIDRGGEVWRVVRPEVSAVEAHASEVPIPDHLIAHTVLNNGTLDDLRSTVQAHLAAHVTYVDYWQHRDARGYVDKSVAPDHHDCDCGCAMNGDTCGCGLTY